MSEDFFPKEYGPDEVWTTEDGTEILIGDLSEEHAKNILRMLLKNRREEQDYFTKHILPQLDEMCDAVETIIIEIDRELDKQEQQQTAAIPPFGGRKTTPPSPERVEEIKQIIRDQLGGPNEMSESERSLTINRGMYELEQLFNTPPTPDASR